MKKRILSLLTCLALCLTLLPVTTLAANTVSYIYYQWNENTQTLSGPIDGTATTATEVTASDTAWGGSDSTEYWYVAQGDVTIGQRVMVAGNVYLILEDTCTLTVNGGIQVAENNSLTIYGQSGGTGKLTVTCRIPIEDMTIPTNTMPPLAAMVKRGRVTAPAASAPPAAR